MSTTLKTPTIVEYKKFKEINNKDRMTDDDIDFLNTYNWNTDTFEENGAYGLKNCIGEVLVPPIFEDYLLLSYHDYKKGSKVVVMKNSKWGLIKIGEENKWILEPEFDYIGYPNNITYVVKDKKYGVINLYEGNFLLPLELDFVTTENGIMFCNGISAYGKNDKQGVIMSNGELTEAIFDEVDAPEMGESIKVRIGDQWGFINENGQFTQDEDEAYYFGED